MTLEIAFVLALLLVAIVCFVTERLSHDMIGLLVIVALGLTRILQPKELFHGFSNEAVVTIGAMFVLSTALVRTGTVAALGAKLTKFSQGSPLRFLAYALTVACVMSAFINNTPVVLVFIPAVLTVCNKLGVSPSKFLIPISFASMLGGSCTLIGTSSNILVSSLSDGAGFGVIGMFEFSTIGIALVIVGMAYLLLFSFRFLPERVTIASTVTSESMREYVTEVELNAHSPLIGKSLEESGLLALGISVIELIRGDRIQRLDRDIPLEENDILLLKGDLNKILELDRKHEINIVPELAVQDGSVKRVEMTLFELLVAPDSNLIGRTCGEFGLRNEYDVSIFALQRHGRHHKKKIADLKLRMGDILLVRGSTSALSKLRKSVDFLILEGVQEEVIERHKAPIAIATILAIVSLATFGILPISVLSVGGVAFLVLARVISLRDAYRSIEWTVLILIAGMIALGEAMGKTGALDLLANQLVGSVGTLGLYGTLWIFYFLTAGLSLLILNKPAAVLMTPLGILLALKLDVDPKPFIMAVAFAASTAMATPMGYQTNLLVYGPGGYEFKDFVKFGLPLNIAVGILACFLIPILWPLQ
ncbi:MAG: SLC13 family permease [Deltaproteobacteria bacterium]|nr:SLC13 family permease [Deltaproteobacteria bacterium]